MKKLLFTIIPVILLTAGLVFAIPSPEKSQSDNQGGLMDKKY